LAEFEIGGHRNAGRAYEMMAQRLRRQPLDRNFVWCADIQRSLHEPLYVDSVHYNAKLSKLIAKCITDAIDERNLLEPNAATTN
jgi:hypothetical protein